MNNINILNNININKQQCGLISFYKNIDIYINNSTFSKNTVKTNGGVLYVFLYDLFKTNNIINIFF